MFSDDEHSGEHWNFPAGIDGRQEASEMEPNTSTWNNASCDIK